MEISRDVVGQVLKAWADSYVEDVPAKHRNGEYLIGYDDLVVHLNNLPEETLSDIKQEVEASNFGD